MENSSVWPFRDIIIKIIPHGRQRYETEGDYWVDEKGALQIRISEFDNPDVSIRIAIHEIMEAWRCAKRGLNFADIDTFDLDHPVDDPGLLKCCPYHTEHMQSMDIERLLCFQDGVDVEGHYNSVPTGVNHG